MRFSKALCAALLLAAGSAHAGPRPSASLAELERVASAGARGGRMLDGAPLSRPALAVGDLRSGAFGAQDSKDKKNRKQDAFVPDPDEMQEATAYKEKECAGLLSCAGAAVITAIKLPFEMAGMGGVLGADIGSGLAWAPGGLLLGLIGAVVGLAAGVILAPIAFLGGIFKGVRSSLYTL